MIAHEIMKLYKFGGFQRHDFEDFCSRGGCRCQLVINEYAKDKDELDAHIDHQTSYGPIIAGITLVGDGTLTFTHETLAGTLIEVDVDVPPYSLYLMTGDSRAATSGSTICTNQWKHGMKKGRCCIGGGRR